MIYHIENDTVAVQGHLGEFDSKEEAIKAAVVASDNYPLDVIRVIADGDKAVALVFRGKVFVDQDTAERD